MSNSNSGATPELFNEFEAIRSNLIWSKLQEILKNEKRIRHRAIREVQYMTEEEQRRWCEENPRLTPKVFKYLHRRVLVEIVRRNEEEALASVKNEEVRRPRRAEVDAFLCRVLSRGRPVPARRIVQEAEQAGISKRTLYRVKAKLGVRSQRQGFGPGGRFLWVWPRRKRSVAAGRQSSPFRRAR